MSKESDRVVITGMGTINPLGLDVETTWRKLLAGKSGAGPITHFDPSDFLTQIACEVKDFNPEDYMSRKDARRLDRYVQFTVAAVTQALEQAKLTIDESNADDVGVIIGSGIGGLLTIDQGYHDLFEKGLERQELLAFGRLRWHQVEHVAVQDELRDRARAE